MSIESILGSKERGINEKTGSKSISPVMGIYPRWQAGGKLNFECVDSMLFFENLLISVTIS